MAERIPDPKKLVVIDKTNKTKECEPLSPKIITPLKKKYRSKPIKPQK